MRNVRGCGDVCITSHLQRDFNSCFLLLFLLSQFCGVAAHLALISPSRCVFGINEAFFLQEELLF